MVSTIPSRKNSLQRIFTFIESIYIMFFLEKSQYKILYLYFQCRKKSMHFSDVLKSQAGFFLFGQVLWGLIKIYFGKMIRILNKSEFTPRYAITFGENTIPDVNNQRNLTVAQHGFSVQHLKDIKEKVIRRYPQVKPQLIVLSDYLPPDIRKENQAAVLFLPGMVNAFLENQHGADLLLEQQNKLQFETKYYNIEREKCWIQRQFRYNLLFADTSRIDLSMIKDCMIKDFREQKYFNQVREKMADFFAVDEYLNREFLLGLPADSNRYYDFKKGVGLHGDIWRKIVIEIGLGRTAVLRYYWKKSLELNKEYMPPLDININHGDMYIMSEKATGQNLKKAYNLVEGLCSTVLIAFMEKSKHSLVHATDIQKYIVCY